MANQQLRTRYTFLAGIDNSVSDELIPDEACSDARNFMPDYTGQGAIIKREGIAEYDATWNDLAVPFFAVSSIYQGQNSTYVTGGSVTGSVTSGIFTFAGDILNTHTAEDWGSDPHWVTFLGFDIFATNLVCKKTSNSTTYTDVTSHPLGAKYLAVSNNFLYYAPSTGGAGTLGWYNAGSLTYSATNELILTKDGNNPIVGLHPYGTGVLVFCRNSFYLVTGDSNLEHGVAHANLSEGCVNGNSIVTTPAGVFWWCKSGIVWLKPDMSLDYPTMRKVPNTILSVAVSSSTLAHAIHDPIQQKVMFYQVTNSGGGGAGPFIRIDYYYTSDRVYIHSGAGVQMYVSGTYIIYNSFSAFVGNNVKPYFYQITGNTDNTAAISAYAETKRESDPDVIRSSRKIIVTTGTSATFTFGVYVDNDTTLDTSWSITPVAGVSDTTIGVNRRHTKLKYRIAEVGHGRGKFISIRPTTRILRQV